MNDTSTATPAPESLRDRMVDRVQAAGWARRRGVEQAMRTVPRHRYVPAAPIEDAYDEQAVITKRAADGAALSCASVPGVVAMMLDQLDVRPGDRILEIGAGTGYNAALLAHLTGRAGHVSTIDIDPEVTAHARQALDATGCRHVHVATADGAIGNPDHAPYDRIIVTVGAWDIPPAWWTQLRPGGRLVVPLRWRGQTRSIAFVRDDDRLRSDSVQLCGFVPMLGQDGERTAPIDPDGHVTLHWDADQPINPATLRGILNHPKSATWSTVTVGSEESFDGIWLRLTATEPGTCRIAATPAAVETDLCTPAIPIRTPALVEHDSLAYLAMRRDPDHPRWTLGAIGHGPTGAELAHRLTDQIHNWNADRTTPPTITAYPAETAHDPNAPQTIKKDHMRLIVSY